MPLKDCDRLTGPGIPPTLWYQSLSAAGLHCPEAHGAARYWLTVEGSFTRALQHICREHFQVDVVREGFAAPAPEEARRLGLPARQLAWIREVRLCGDGQPWVLARTVIPQSCLRGQGRRLRNLGNKPLGAYLFSSSEWQRGPLETGLCKSRDASAPRLARRSLFYRSGCALMVGEYLLPRLYQSTNRG
ncbi:chorismate--pyruvate lyase family protein [Marinobacter sp. VGCF2001]|uniref:chorismate--pyruvate lyase family protein n=1 Tax=Marinobacter sp. VGCF2001 TaxID=3417189 RepID=UPI003CE6CD05